MTDDVPVRVLVVDDNPATLYATSRVLQSAGFTVIEAATGGEALARADESPDLVVLDVNLPDMDGFQVCRELRARQRTVRTPVIHLSATFVKDVDKVQGLEAGADGYLTHPVEPPVLIATVNAFLRARQAEEAMRRSEGKFKAIFEQALDGIALLSHDMTCLEVNPAMCQILGRPAGEIVGRPLWVFTPGGREDEVAAVAAPLAATGAWRGSFPLVRADGRRVELDWSISLHSLPGVRLAIVSDVTGRALVEAERERLLASERAARAEAERANRLKDEFLATLSHELRTPLNSILGWSQFLKNSGAGGEDVAEGIDAIERNARVQTELINDLLDVARITSGKLRLNLESIDPARTVGAALDSVMPAANAKEIEVERLLEPDAGPITWDPARLQQVVWNLVNNAVKFTPKNGKIRVGLTRAESLVQITVTDNGQGIRPDFLPHLFERFRQGEGGARRGHGGLGLGLAIVKHLVEMHGGTVTASSAGVGHGSTFTVRLPVTAIRGLEPPAGEQSPGERDAGATANPALADSAAPTAARARAAAAAAPQPFRPVTAPDLAGTRVLVVDDDPDARALVHRVLTDAGAIVTDAASASTALQAVDAFAPHVLVSDIGMPGQDGYDLIRRLRERGYSPQNLPAIALTAFARDEDRRHVLAAGYQRHLAKPVDANELLLATAALATAARGNQGAA
jgi:PAS domain S-box-containing protein